MLLLLSMNILNRKLVNCGLLEQHIVRLKMKGIQRLAPVVQRCHHAPPCTIATVGSHLTRVVAKMADQIVVKKTNIGR